jgi:hypothetical protein
MKKYHLIIVAATLLNFTTETATAQGAVGSILKGVGQIVKSRAVIGGATILATAGGAVALDRYLAKGEAVYALEFDLNNDVSSIYWADYFSKPDVFPVLQVAGMGTYLIPDISTNYAGGKVIWTFKIPSIPGGRDISVFLNDDDSSSDQIWNGILSARWEGSLGGGITMLRAIELKISNTLSFQLLKNPIVIDAPEQLCVYSITTPRFYFGGDWDSEGELKNAKGIKVGSVKFSQLINK